MKAMDVVVVGAGQAGLAMSRCLSEHGLSHVVLEQGRLAQSWRSRWNSLRLLTPNWQTRLPGFRYRGDDPDGFMTKQELVAFLEQYAIRIAAPVHEESEVLSVGPTATGRFQVLTTTGPYAARNVVIATGHCAKPHIPAQASSLSAELTQLTPGDYSHAGALPQGGVLVVGASATGVQLAEEIQASGRQVTLAVGRHCRLPRRYRGRDIMAWLDQTGILHERADQVRDVSASRRSPSLQLIGSDNQRSLDLNTLQRAGVRLSGRLLAANGMTLHCALDLEQSVAASEAKLQRLLSRIDAFIESEQCEPAPKPAMLRPISVPATPSQLDLARNGIRTVIWATGFVRRYPWLHVPVLNEAGEITHEGGVTPCPGLYVIGLNFMRRRGSSYIDGVGRDARELSGLIRQQLEHEGLSRARGLSRTYLLQRPASRGRQ